MRNSLLLLGIAPLCWSSASYADWQYTHWGMTPEQTAAASKGTVHVGRGPDDEQLPGSDLSALGTYQSGEYHFNSRFYYTNGKLSEVRLTLVTDNPDQDNINLRHSLLGKYGTPFDSSGTFIITFHDKSSNNRIDMMDIGGVGATVIYRPLIDSNSGGL